jgi:hypothetical protein
MQNRPTEPAEVGAFQDALRTALESQYHAALAMLREAVELCPDEAWDSAEHHNRCWQIAYHALFFTHLYLQPNEAAFRPWPGQDSDVQHPDAIPGPPDPGSVRPLLPKPYTKAEVLAYWDFCDAMVDPAVDALDLASPESGFHWYAMSKLEHQLVNIRHIAHHAGQLTDRVRAAAGAGVRWVGARRGRTGEP